MVLLYTVFHFVLLNRKQAGWDRFSCLLVQSKQWGVHYIIEYRLYFTLTCKGWLADASVWLWIFRTWCSQLFPSTIVITHSRKWRGAFSLNWNYVKKRLNWQSNRQILIITILQCILRYVLHHETWRLKSQDKFLKSEKLCLGDCPMEYSVAYRCALLCYCIA